jgi:hypothetical protein
MTKLTTATLIVGPRRRAPWGDRLWAVSAYVSLIEGGSAAYWMSTSVDPRQHNARPAEVVIESPDVDSTVDSLLILLGAHLGGADVAGLLEATHNISVSPDGTREVAPYWELDERVGNQLGELLARDLRLGFTQLDGECLIDSDVLARLGSLGFDLEVYNLDRSLTISQV